MNSSWKFIIELFFLWSSRWTVVENVIMHYWVSFLWISRSVFFNLGSAEPRGSAKIFLGSAKFLTTIFYNIWANKVAKNWTKKSLYWVMLRQVSLGDNWLGKVRYFLLNYKIWGSCECFLRAIWVPRIFEGSFWVPQPQKGWKTLL